ncbi:MAG: flagellar hook protein FlgE [Bosea sp. (in: a-proteobacteria)]
MGVFGAMTTALSGLRAQSYALENISGNIANSRTTGFKRVDTSFADLVPDTPANRELSGSVLARSAATNSVQGDISTTSIATNVALNGDGFFIVAEKQNDLNGVPTFAQTNLYTRRGDFDFDRNGFLVNGAGYYLKGLTLDPSTGNATGSEADVIKVSNDALPPRATTQIEYRATLPATPNTAAYQAANGAIGSELLGAATQFPASPATLATIAASDSAALEGRSIQGGTITGYDSLGRPVPVRLAWAKTAAAVPPVPGPAAPDAWSLYVQTDPAATGAGTRWTRAGTAGQFTFDTTGNLTSAANLILPAVTVSGVTVTGINLTTGVGGSGMKQVYSTQNVGQLEANAIQQDGYSAGVLQNTTISEDGKVQGSYSNGQTRPLAQLLTARFASPNSLKRLDGGAMSETLESGLPLVGSASSGGTQLVGSAVEQSNTDIADEFAKMIVTQQAYSANTRVITTSQQMLSDILNIIR